MDVLSVRGAVNAFVFGILFGWGWLVAANIARLITSLIGAR